MQEEVENRTVTLVISATKLTGRVLKAAVAKFLAHQKAKIAEKKRAGPVKPTGKQTVKQLVGQNQGVANIEISDKNIKDFDRVARKYGVDYAVKKDKTLSPPKYMVFFKARDADALTAAFEEYTRNTARKRQKPSSSSICMIFRRQRTSSSLRSDTRIRGWSYEKACKHQENHSPQSPVSAVCPAGNQVWAGCAVSTGAGLLSKSPAYSGWLPAGL